MSFLGEPSFLLRRHDLPLAPQCLTICEMKVHTAAFKGYLAIKPTSISTEMNSDWAITRCAAEMIVAK